MELNSLYKRSGSQNQETKEQINGKIPRNPVRFLMKKQASLFTFANFRYVAECLISYYVLVPVMICLLPFICSYWVMKKLEWLVRLFFDKSAWPLSGEDSLWQQDSDINRLIISTVLIMDRPSDEEKALKDFKKRVFDRLVDSRDSNGRLQFRRARQIIHPGLFQYFFIDDPNFNMDNHVFRYDGKRPKTKEELQDIVSELSSQPLRTDRSPWYFCFIPTDLEESKDAVVFRINHSMADGVSLVKFLTRVLPDHHFAQEPRKKFTHFEHGLIYTKAAFIFARTLFKQLLNFADKSIIHGPEMTGKKNCTWAKPLDLSLVKKIKTATGTTVNDVLVACLTFAVRRYQINKGVATPPDFRASVPVDVSGSSDEIKFQNKFAIVFVSLPSSHEDIVDVLYETKRRIDGFKVSGEPFAMATMMRLTLDSFPEIVTKPLLTFITRKATCVLSNVPGPQHVLSVNGSSVRYITFWPPQKSNVGIGLSIFSYAGQVMIGVLGDESVLNDPESITDLFRESVQELADRVIGDCN